MDALAYDLKNICDRNRDGGHTTRANRHRTLQLATRQLRRGGFRLKSAHSLKPKHVKYLVGQWQHEGLQTGTIKNRMGAVRWWAGKVNKASVIPADNIELGIENRERDDSDRGQKLDLEKMENVECPRMQMSMRLMSAFGLRMEEALKFNPDIADQGDKIALKPSWTKGGRYREIPIHTERHRELLNEAKELAEGGSLIPEEKSYIQHRKAFENCILKNGFSNLHGLRHNYAQWRYQQLTGWKAPKLDDGKKREDMNPFQLKQDAKALQIIAKELGHNRPAITKVYVG